MNDDIIDILKGDDGKEEIENNPLEWDDWGRQLLCQNLWFDDKPFNVFVSQFILTIRIKPRWFNRGAT